MRISYPEDFADDVRSEFGDRTDVIDLLDNGDCALGRVLAEEAAKRVEPREVVRALGEGDQVGLMTRAESLVRRAAIYKKWIRVAMDNFDEGEVVSGSSPGQATGM